MSGGDVRASARGHAQQAVIGQGVQHNYFYGASGSARPGVVLSTLIPPPSILVGGHDRPASLAAGLRAGIAPGKPARRCCTAPEVRAGRRRRGPSRRSWQRSSPMPGSKSIWRDSRPGALLGRRARY
ncbi:hypothetical protein OH828_07445 [Streptomyces anulatus]|uniref:hypothetical protein n=1 Tax=Streptomyces TaxID=1883 RepID=UPI001180DC27|nr:MULTISPECIES: hypothetical protein [unclassified Streptomyces]